MISSYYHNFLLFLGRFLVSIQKNKNNIDIVSIYILILDIIFNKKYFFGLIKII